MTADPDELNRTLTERTSELDRTRAELSRERERREQELQELRRQLDAVQRCSTDQQHFASLAAHELQEPARTMESFALRLQKRLGADLDADSQEDLTLLVDGARRMQILIRDLLDYARADCAPTPRLPVALDLALARAQSNLAEALRAANAQVRSESLPEVPGDSSQLVLLLQNLLSNAIKYRSGTPPQICITAVRQGREWTISVADNGIGIAADHIDKLFSLFQRLHSRGEYPGTGIGLALCRRIVERHGGRIWVESTPGLGSTFRFTLPAGVEAAP